MAKRGDTAREMVKNTIIAAFQIAGGYVGYQDKKIYVTAKEGGEDIQFSIALTMPKSAAEVTENIASEGVEPVLSTQLSTEDQEQVERLKRRLIEMGVYPE